MVLGLRIYQKYQQTIKVKFIIPITDSLIMISYTDGKNAKYWHNKSMNDTQLETLNKSLHKILPNTKISESQFI